MARPTVLVISTLDTKQEETQYLVDCLSHHGIEARTVDMSLQSGGRTLDGPDKLEAMDTATRTAIDAVSEQLSSGSVHAVIGLGCGTGGEMALRVMRALPITFPKVLVTTLPFDPRVAAADSSIVLVPTLADICGLNPILREVLENAAALTAGLCSARSSEMRAIEPSIGISALGATEGAVNPLISALRERGHESTVFHANGYGGAAFARFCEQGAFHTIIDLTPHELTRIHIAGAHVVMPDRFTMGAHLPRIILPGALNFIGLGEKSTLPQTYTQRPHYSHSGFFTHAKVTEDEMRLVAGALAENMNTLSGPTTLIVPLGGFSHRDCPGGEIEDRALREVFLEHVSERLDNTIGVKVVDAHIASSDVTSTILETLDALQNN
ncbi:MAG: Tm-1-like ATP-binding domain-containing protein [Pseudomonadota bacterium]